MHHFEYEESRCYSELRKGSEVSKGVCYSVRMEDVFYSKRVWNCGQSVLVRIVGVFGLEMMCYSEVKGVVSFGMEELCYSKLRKICVLGIEKEVCYFRLRKTLICY